MPWKLYQQGNPSDQQGNPSEQQAVRDAVKKFIDIASKEIRSSVVRLEFTYEANRFFGFNVIGKCGAKFNGLQAPARPLITAFLFECNAQGIPNKIAIARSFDFANAESLSKTPGGQTYFNKNVKKWFSYTASISSSPPILVNINSAPKPDDHLVVVQFSVAGGQITIDEPTTAGGAPDWKTLGDRFASYCEAKDWIQKQGTLPPPPPPPPPGNGAQIANALNLYRNVILEGVPGTGKTYHVGKLAGYDEKRWITFHPAVSYEDFMEGIRPAAASQLDDDNPPLIFDRKAAEGDAKAEGFTVRDGFFLKVCLQAYKKPAEKFLVVIDEINRANLPNVLGDLLTLLEADKRLRYDEDNKRWIADTPTTVTLPYSGYRFAVPKNVFVIGTMNTTDKSIAPIDSALRRRFAFIRIEPMTAGDVTQHVNSVLSGKCPKLLTDSIHTWEALNSVLRTQLGPDGVLGHSYLLQLANRLAEDGIEAVSVIRMCWQFELLPQLIDTLTNHAKVELLKSEEAPLPAFHKFLEGLDLTITLEGDGFGRGLRIGTIDREKNQSAAGESAAGESTAGESAADESAAVKTPNPGHESNSEQGQAQGEGAATPKPAESVAQAAE